MKVGLYFGSFNPIHNGHLIIANHILNETDLKKVWFVVSPQNPFKPSSTLLNEYDRLHLVNKAIDNDDRLKGSDVEFALPKPSYTYYSLAHLREKYPEYHFVIIMGSDSFQNLKNWKNYEAIIENYEIIIYERPGFGVENMIGAKIKIMKAPLLEISATYIRELAQNNKSIKYLVPESVEREIIDNRFFKLQRK